MTDIATTEPGAFTKGDYVQWKRSLDDYKASAGWTLTYYFRGDSTLNKAATASGDDHLLTLSTSDTDSLTAGEYAWAAKVSKASELYTIAIGNVTVRPDIADENSGYESRPHCKIMLDAIEAILQGKATQDVLSYSIQGRSLTRMNVEELETWRDKYRKEWQSFQKKLARKNGRLAQRKIKVRFNR